MPAARWTRDKAAGGPWRVARPGSPSEGNARDAPVECRAEAPIWRTQACAARLGTPFGRTRARRASRRDGTGTTWTRRQRHRAFDQAGFGPGRIAQRTGKRQVRFGRRALVAGGWRGLRCGTGGSGVAHPSPDSAPARMKGRILLQKRAARPRVRSLPPERGDVAAAFLPQGPAGVVDQHVVARARMVIAVSPRRSASLRCPAPPGRSGCCN